MFNNELSGYTANRLRSQFVKLVKHVESNFFMDAIVKYKMVRKSKRLGVISKIYIFTIVGGVEQEWPDFFHHGPY